METNKGIAAFHAKTRSQWRKWLEKNCDKKQAVCLIIYHKKSDTKSIYQEEAVEEALCFGWIDSLRNKRDAESVYQKFSPRKASSNWSQINMDRAKKMIKEGLMTEHGLNAIAIAKKKGKWGVKKVSVKLKRQP